MSKTAKKYVIMGIIFSLIAITFALLFYFKAIKYLDLTLAVTYVLYFSGMALLYSGVYIYRTEHSKIRSACLNILFGGIFVIISTILLIYGFCVGDIALW